MKVKTYEGKEPYILISYAHKDMDKVMPIVERLDKDGYRLWYDEGIAPIETWDDFIAGKVEECEIMLAFISTNYINSSNCMDELNYARDNEKKILRVHIEKDVVLPRGVKMRLNSIQAVFRTDYESEDDFFEKLYFAKDISMCLKAKNKRNIQTLRYENGVYEGETIDGIPNGHGKAILGNGSMYEGEWQYGKPNGHGRLIYYNGNVYEGEWKNGKIDGQVKITFPDGTVYEGEWKNGARNGQGKITFFDGTVYEGEWKNDNRDGQGKITFFDGCVYEGEWKDDKPNGYGKVIFPDGRVIKGKCENGILRKSDI